MTEHQSRNIPLLEVRDLVVKAGRGELAQTIVDQVSFNLQPGKVLGLIGESGAGKSTLGLAAIGYFRPGCYHAGGTIKFEEQKLLDLGEKQLRAIHGTRMAYVAQSAFSAFNPGYKIGPQLIEVAVHRVGMDLKAARSAAREKLELFGITDPDSFCQRFPHQVSGGQLQRAMVAMATLVEPDLVVFDEPTTALDVTTQIGVLASIRTALKTMQLAALYITHDIAVVAQIADDILVLRNAKEVEFGSTEEIISNPRHPYTRTLVDRHEEKSIQNNRHIAGKEPAIVSVRDIEARFGHMRVVHGVSLDVGPQETVAIVGESGSGKTTLARVIAGLHEASAGDIVFQGTTLPPRLENRSMELLRKIQFIQQNPDTALNPRRSVGRILGHAVTRFQGLRGEKRSKRVLELLQMVELEPDTAGRTPQRISGGQAQRVGIARALAAEPELIICDEITSALDVSVGDQILELLKSLQRDLGVSYLFVTHDISLLHSLAHRVAVMKDGAIVEIDTVDKVLGNPSNAYTRDLMASVPRMDPGWLTQVLEGNAGRTTSLAP